MQNTTVASNIQINPSFPKECDKLRDSRAHCQACFQVAMTVSSHFQVLQIILFKLSPWCWA